MLLLMMMLIFLGLAAVATPSAPSAMQECSVHYRGPDLLLVEIVGKKADTYTTEAQFWVMPNSSRAIQVTYSIGALAVLAFEGGYDGLFVSVSVRKAGDINGDGKADADDVAIFGQQMGLSRGEPGFDGMCDFNGDNAVDTVDLLMLVGQ